MSHSLLEQFDWDEDREDHIARHRVNIDEVLQVLANRPVAAQWEGDKREIFGQTDAGRYLLVVVGSRRWSRRIWLVTARDMTEAEKRLYRRRKGL